MVSLALILAVVFRSISLLFPHTYFQPDEFYQALEPAHRLVFGYGFLTWEWKDIPLTLNATDSWWTTYVAAGRMRSWLWPSCYALMYKAVQLLNLDSTRMIAFVPRLIGVLVAAFTDYATYLLAGKLMGDGARAGALFLSLTSLFNAHLLPRALSTSPETLLTNLALLYFPLTAPKHPARILVGRPPKVASIDLRDVQTAAGTTTEGPVRRKVDDAEVYLQDASELNYAVMDRMAPHVKPPSNIPSNLYLSAFFASLAICLRPTTIPLWAYLGSELSITMVKRDGLPAAVRKVAGAVFVAAITLGLSTGLDYAITGQLCLPLLTFVHQNIFRNISSFYGTTNLSYHFVQSIPIMLFPIWWWWFKGFTACLLPIDALPKRLQTLDRPEGMRTLARAITFTIGTLSLSPHSEWRFLHPLLPSFLLFALPVFFQDHIPLIFGCYRLVTSIRQYIRIPKFPFFLCLLAPVVPWIYLNNLHGIAQVEVVNALRRGDMGTVTGLVVLAPCHSFPWASHLHQDVDGWFLTCEPPLQDNPFDHVTSQEMFYGAPVKYLNEVFPSPPIPLHDSIRTLSMTRKPSHVIGFGELLDRKDQPVDVKSVAGALYDLGYEPVWYRWNGFDFAQDESERRGGVYVWALRREA